MAAAGVDERLHLPPERLREDVLLVAELAAALGERLGLVVTPERAERAAQHRRVGRENAAPAAGLEQVAGPAEVSRRVLVAAGGRRDLAEIGVDPVVAGQVAIVVAGLARELGCLVEAGEHGQQPGARHQQLGMRVLGKEAVEGAQRLVRRPRPVAERRVEAEKAEAASSGEASVTERLLRRVRIVFVAAVEVRDRVAEHPPDERQAGVVVCLLEQRQRLPRELLELGDIRIGLNRTR